MIPRRKGLWREGRPHHILLIVGPLWHMHYPRMPADIVARNTDLSVPLVLVVGHELGQHNH